MPGIREPVDILKKSACLRATRSTQCGGRQRNIRYQSKLDLTKFDFKERLDFGACVEKADEKFINTNRTTYFHSFS